MTTIDRIPTATLIQRYGKTKLYTQYFKDLGITPIRDGSSSYITPEENDRIEGYHEARGRGKQAVEIFLAQFGTSENVLERPELGLERSELGFKTQDTPGTYGTPILTDVRLFQFLEVMARHFSAQANPLANLEAIERAYERGWQLSSSQLAPLIGCKKMPKSPVRRFGFMFERIGRNGAEAAWRISKI
jgi:hypothetical protein